MVRRVVALVCLVALAVAMPLRWDKTTATEGIRAVIYLRDRWTGQSYVQTWGVAAGGDGRGKPVPTFSQESKEAYYRKHMAEKDLAREFRYGLITGTVSPLDITQKGIQILEINGFSTDIALVPGEADRLRSEIDAAKERLAAQQSQDALRLRDTLTVAWSVCAVGSALLAVLPSRRKSALG